MLKNVPEFIGLDTQYKNAEGRLQRRLHLDGAASPLAARRALECTNNLLPHYSNSHSHVHNSARISTQALAWAHQQALDYVNAQNTEFTAVFMGSGTTAAINRVARGLHAARADRSIVLVSAMEHHANDLPHRQFGNEVHHIPLAGTGSAQGAVDLEQLEKLLRAHAGQVNYVAFSSVSNVTGIINNMAEICALAHRYDALVMVDAAQAVAHMQFDFSALTQDQQPDFFIFSGHKVYCPTAPGVLIARRSILAPLSGQDLGGGAVLDVSYYDFELLNLPEREQAGTPNIVGAVALGSVLKMLREIGQSAIEAHARALQKELAEALSSLPNIQIYGDERASRVGALAFNHRNIDHGLLAAILNDYYMIAVRNECFCAHPYVSSLLKEELWQLDLNDVPAAEHEAFINRKRGMVRASLSLYNTSADIEQLIVALSEIDARIDELQKAYTALPDGNYQHRSYQLDWQAELKL